MLPLSRLSLLLQYMVVDLKRFQPRKQLQHGLLWVVEQLPGMVEAADMTNTLSRGYCESSNVWCGCC